MNEALKHVDLRLFARIYFWSYATYTHVWWEANVTERRMSISLLAVEQIQFAVRSGKPML